MSQYQTIKTQAGMALEASADTGGPSIKLVAMSLGDGGGHSVSVSTTQTGLVHEVDRVSLNRLQQNPNDATQWVAEAIFPADRGGYTVREVGLWTDSGVLFAVAAFPETYKPAPSEGTAGQLIIELNFRAANSDNVTLVVDASLQLATQEWVGEQLIDVVRSELNDSNFQINHVGVNKNTGDIWGWNAVNNIFFHMATVQALQAESLRAQTAEAGLQPAGNYVTGNGFSSGDAAVTNIWRDSQGGLSVNVHDGTVIQLPRREDVAHLLENAVQTVADDADFQINHIGVNKNTGDIWGWNAASGTFFHMASVQALQAESLRAQTAEAGLQPAGNYVTGNGFSSGDAAVTNIWRDSQGGLSVNVRDGAVIQLPRREDVAHLLENAVQTFADDADFQINHVGVNKNTGDIWGWNAVSGTFFHMASVQALQAESLRAQTAEAGLQPTGNYVRAVGLSRKKEQSFTVSAVHGQRINFPEQFTDDDVQVVFSIQDSGNNRFHVANFFGQPDRTGFGFSLNAWTGSTFANETNPTLICVRAIGNG